MKKPVAQLTLSLIALFSEIDSQALIFLQPRTAESPYATQLEQFQKDFPQVKIESCSTAIHPLHFPELPPALEAKFNVSLHFTEILRENSHGSTQRKVSRTIAYSPETLCRSPENVEIFGRWSMLLYRISSRNTQDDIALDLIEKSNELGGPIELTITPDTKTFEAVHGKIEEETWFGHGDGKIYWAEMTDCRGLACAGPGTSLSVLRHELAHVLIYRALGAQYPKNKFWHDLNVPTYEKALGKKVASVSASFVTLKSSESAALIEGVAFALESGASLGNAFIAPMKEIFALRDNKDGLFCYAPEDLLRTVDFENSKGEFQAPRESEAYVGSTLTALIGKSAERAKQLISAIVSARPSTIEELAFAYNKEGRAQSFTREWLREFYFYDLTTGHRIDSEFEWVAGTAPTDSKKFCVPQFLRGQFFSSRGLDFIR